MSSTLSLHHFRLEADYENEDDQEVVVIYKLFMKCMAIIAISSKSEACRNRKKYMKYFCFSFSCKERSEKATGCTPITEYVPPNTNTSSGREEDLNPGHLDYKSSAQKPLPNDCNTPTQHIATLLSATCCSRSAHVLRHVGCCWLKFENGQICLEPTTPNMSKQGG